MEAGELERLERLAANASPGPWVADYFDETAGDLANFDVRTPEQATGGIVCRQVGSGAMVVFQSEGDATRSDYAAQADEMPAVASARTISRGRTPMGELFEAEPVPLHPHDAAFIAASRAAVPALCAAVRDLQARNLAMAERVAAQSELLSKRAEAAVPVGEWSRNPPTKPGWYWHRDSEHELPHPVEVWVNDHIAALCCNAGVVRRMGGEWWNISIQPPGA